jgi:uncharacterized protein with HEPN domain
MRASAQLALRYAREHPTWPTDQLVIDAIAKRIEDVADAAKMRFPRALRDEFPEIPWDEIAGMLFFISEEFGLV